MAQVHNCAMTSAWNEGYFADLDYTFGYFGELNPVFQRFCLISRGFTPLESSADSAHCELGFGQGVSINVHAAANPGMYWGTDFQPAHAAHASKLARSPGVAAVLADDSFEQFLGRPDLPRFQTIGLHGVWSWISRENQRLIVEFARRHLLPGGAFYLSYNSQPGWAAAQPMRQLFAFHDRFAAKGAGAEQRVETAYRFVEGLFATDPGYLKDNPGLSRRLASIQPHDVTYVAPEYLGREWHCEYFVDVVDALAPAKLEYACLAAPSEFVDAVHIGRGGLEQLARIEHPILREQTRDYHLNRSFRKDLYLRGVTRLNAHERANLLLDMRFALTTPQELVPGFVSGRMGEAQLQDDLYRPLVAALASSAFAPKTLRELAALVSGHPLNLVVQAITMLVGLRAVAPCQSSHDAASVASRCAALNAEICRRALDGPVIPVLASPVTGGGIEVNRGQQIFLHAQSLGMDRPEDWAAYSLRELLSRGQAVVRNGERFVNADQSLEVLRQDAITFRNRDMPLLRALQIVT